MVERVADFLAPVRHYAVDRSAPRRVLLRHGAAQAPSRRRRPRTLRAALPRRPAARIDWWRLAPVLCAPLIAIVYLIWEPRTVDLAAHTFRAELFGQEGFTIWNGQWYGGHHTPAYSILSPPLAWLLGPPIALALAAVASAALFEPLARRHFGADAGALGRDLVRRRHRHAAVHGAAAVRARRRVRPRRAARAAARAATCWRRPRRPVPARQPGRGPVPRDGAASRSRSRSGATARSASRASCSRPSRSSRRVAALVGVPRGRLGAVPVLGLPARSRSSRSPACCAPARGAALRWGAVALRARGDARARDRHADGRQRRAPRRAVRRAAAARARSGAGRGRASAVFAPCSPSCFVPLAFWQWSPAVRDVIKYLEDPAAKSDYFEPLRQFLYTVGGADQRGSRSRSRAATGRARRSRCDAPLARGWLRQLDTGRNPIFYRGRAQPAHLRDLAGRERRPLRGAAEREAGQELATASAR